MKIYQLVPAMHYGDAVGDSVRLIRDLLQTHGHSCDIYSITIDEILKDEIKEWEAFSAGYVADSITILHFVLPSPMTEPFAHLPGGKILIYHNITPADFFKPYDRELATIARVGRQQLRSLATSVHLALGDSEYNREELEELGFHPTGVFPIPFDSSRYQQVADPMVIRMFSDEAINLLFVGRVAPNKKIEDLIKLSTYFKNYFTSKFRLIIVGKTDRVKRYYYQLLQLVEDLKLDRKEVIFTGHIDFSQLISYYKVADLFLSLSEHEGFCVPLLESMFFQLPILAYNCTAIPHTLGESGILINQKELAEIAELCYFIARDNDIRKQIIDKQNKRLKHFSLEKTEKRLLAFIDEVMK
jgi:glycosyltransferase involved in cell wall biosynthesis